MSDLFDNVDTVEEINTSIKYYYKYYNEVKKYLKSESVCESIEVVLSAIQNNFQYVTNFYFKDMCTFDFKGEFIVEAANSGLITVYFYEHSYIGWNTIKDWRKPNKIRT